MPHDQELLLFLKKSMDNNKKNIFYLNAFHLKPCDKSTLSYGIIDYFLNVLVIT